MLNGLGKAVARGRLTRDKPLLFWQEVQASPVRMADVAVNETLLELALKYNLAVYDAAYLGLVQTRRLPLATVDGKLQQAAEGIGMRSSGRERRMSNIKRGRTFQVARG